MAYLTTRGHLNVDDLFNSFFAAPRRVAKTNGETTTAWTPHVNLKETETGYTVEAELPGLTADDVEIEFQDETLTLKGSRTEETKQEGETWHLTERRHGSFERRFRFPALIDADSFTASFKNGLLQIEVKKAAEVQPRKIQIKSAE